MIQNSNKTSNSEIIEFLSLYLSRWKLILVSIIFFVLLGHIYLRYATSLYNASVTIKINDEMETRKLPELDTQTGGFKSKSEEKIADEINIIKSRSLIKKVVEKLKLNIRCYEQGRIKTKEFYRNPPVKLSFFASDSTINKVKTTIYLKIESPTKFSIIEYDTSIFADNSDLKGINYSFGDRVPTEYGDFVISPNIDNHKPKTGSILRVDIVPVDRIVGSYQRNINVSNDKGSSIIKLSLKSNLKEKAADILNALIDEYNKDAIKDKEEIVKITSDFITNRLEIVSQELARVDLTAETLEKKNRLTALGSQTNIYLQSEQQNEAKISNTTNQIQLIDFLQKRLESDDTTSDLLPQDIGISDNAVSQITKSHNDLVIQRDRILRNSSPKNPTVINLNNQIKALRQGLSNNLNTMKSTNEITLNSLNVEDRRIRGQIYSAPRRERQFRDIKRQQNIKEALYLYLFEKREETAIRLGMSSPNAKIIDSAYASSLPVSPNKKMVYLAMLLIGLVLPMGYIYTLDLLDTKIHTKEDLFKLLSIPYIGEIPLNNKKKRTIDKIDYSPKAEAFRIVRSNIDFLLKGLDKKSKTIFVTSTRAKEGKSHTSVNLAKSISFSEKSVLLIETDIRVPKVKEYLNINDTDNKSLGLTDFIIDKSTEVDDIIIKSEDNYNLDIIPAGTIPPNPAELLMSDRIKTIFKSVEKKYDYIIVDTAAVGIVTDTLLISDFADLFVYVVSANNVDGRRLVSVANSMYESNRLPNMTMLLNGTEPGKKGYGYGYGYGNNPNRKKKWWKFKKA